MNEFLKTFVDAGKALLSWNPTANQLYGILLLNLLVASTGIALTNYNNNQCQPVNVTEVTENNTKTGEYKEECAESCEE